MKRLLLILSSLLVPALAVAGETRAFDGVRCVNTIRAGDALLGGWHTGNMPPRVFLQRCDGLWMRLQGGRLMAMSTRHIPKFKPRNKPLAIPDGRVSVGARDIMDAWLTRPTLRHGHGVLGDAVEAGGLAARTRRGLRVETLLPASMVFEDRLARLADLDGDGRDEILVVRTHLEHGAQVAIYGLRESPERAELRLLAASTPLGTRHRWLNPAAAGDFDGDGRLEIAWVETPHLRGVLKVARLERRGERHFLRELAALPGFSNHARGSRELQQALALDWNGDGRAEIVLPDISRKKLMVVALRGDMLEVIDEMPIGGEIDSPILAADLDGDGRGEALLVTRDARLLVFSPGNRKTETDARERHDTR